MRKILIHVNDRVFFEFGILVKVYVKKYVNKYAKSESLCQTWEKC